MDAEDSRTVVGSGRRPRRGRATQVVHLPQRRETASALQSTGMVRFSCHLIRAAPSEAGTVPGARQMSVSTLTTLCLEPTFQGSGDSPTRSANTKPETLMSFIQVWQVDSVPTADQTPVAPFLGGAVLQPRVPRQGNGEANARPSIRQQGSHQSQRSIVPEWSRLNHQSTHPNSSQFDGVPFLAHCGHERPPLSQIHYIPVGSANPVCRVRRARIPPGQRCR